MLDWLVYASVGKLIITLWMKFYLPHWLSKFTFVEKLHECGLCSGVYIYSILGLFLGIDILYSWFHFWRIPIFGEIITGMVTSWIVHVFSVGFKELYLQIFVE